MAADKTTQRNGGGSTRHWGEQPHRRLAARRDSLPIDATIATPSADLVSSGGHIHDTAAQLGAVAIVPGCAAGRRLQSTSRRQRKQMSRGASTSGASGDGAAAASDAVRASVIAGALVSATGASSWVRGKGWGISRSRTPSHSNISCLKHDPLRRRH